MSDVAGLSGHEGWLYVLQLTAGLVFVCSVVPKLADFSSFAVVVRDYRILPGSVTKLAAALVVVSEAFVATVLVLGLAPVLGSAVGLALCITFLAAVVISLRRGADISCGCFGAEGDVVTGRTAARLCALGAAQLLLLLGTVVGADVPQTGDLVGRGDDGLLFVLNALALATFAVVAAMWAFLTPELARVLRLARRTHDLNPQEGQ